MTLIPLVVGDNPQQPSIISETYIPDQLIAGNLKLVSDNGILTGSAILPRGSVLGQATVGATPTTSTGKAYATDTIAVAALPAAAGTDTLTLGNGSTTTAISFVPLPANQVEEVLPANTQYILGTTALQAAALCEFLNASTDPNININTYTVSGSTITATAKIIGTGGNAYTLATNNSSTFTVGGATFSGGTANTGTATIGTLSFGPASIPGAYTIVLTSATAFNVFKPNGDELGQGVMGTAFKNPELNFTITTGGSPAALDSFVVTSTPLPTAGLWKLAVAGATDGSDVPAAILADLADPTGGNVNCGYYVMGEFNINAIFIDSSLSPLGVKAAFARSGIFLKNAITAGDPS